MPEWNHNETASGLGQDEGWALADRVRAGEGGAFDALMERYKRPVLNFVFRLIGDAAEAEDVAQEVFVRAYRSLRKPGFGPTTAAFSTWLFQVARNAAVDCMRRRGRRPAESLSVLEAGGNALPARQATAAEEAVARETGAAIAAAVASLPEDQRTALILSEYEGLPDARIAAIMRCSAKSVEARLYRGRRFLRERLKQLIQR